MKIVYASCLCSKDKFNKLFENSNKNPGQQVQKYHRLLVEGLVNNNIGVTSVSVLPVSRNNCKKTFFKYEKEINNNIHYSYLPLINFTIIKNIVAFINSFSYVLFSCFNKKDYVIIGDVLNISVCAGALCAAKILRLHNVGIVTDIPSFLSKDSRKFSVKVNNNLIKSFDSYLFLTEDMNELINKENKPYLVIEGLVDVNMKEVDNILANKYQKKICIYAGGIEKKYGIKYLTEAFIKANIENSELHIYGNGDFEEELIEICKNNNNIKYFGVMLNDYIVQEELKSTLLINPRPTNEEYTKYSFPSKNMEYMVSGTPVLTTKLPGMPKEYYQYVYLVEDESIDGLSQMLVKILSKTKEELYEKGKSAKEFVLRQKNNIVQSKKIIELINNYKQL
jgi:glycosyltransferase involved in cell wall biosynthesis